MSLDDCSMLAHASGRADPQVVHGGVIVPCEIDGVPVVFKIAGEFVVHHLPRRRLVSNPNRRPTSDVNLFVTPPEPGRDFLIQEMPVRDLRTRKPILCRHRLASLPSSQWAPS